MRQLSPSPPADTADQGDVDLAAVYALPPGRHLRVNFISSVDGAAEVEGTSGALGGAADQRVFATLRRLADVVLVGAGTARAENYGPVTVTGRPAGQLPPLALVSRSLRLSPEARFFTEPGPRPIVITCTAADPPGWLDDVADLVRAGDDEVDLAAALDELAGRGLEHVLCEGGPGLFADLCTAGLVDELCLTLAPVLAGPGRRGILSGPAWARPAALHLASVLEEDGVLLLRYTARALTLA